MSLLPLNIGKAATERYWLAYTPVWSVAAGVVMIGGIAEWWSDLAALAFGMVLAAGAWVGPIRKGGEAGKKLAVSVTLLAFTMNWTATPFFYDVLHMHYAFPVSWTLRNNPIFLYFVTVAYFATYCALCLMAFRWLRGLGAWARPAAWVVAPMAVAFLETVLNANPFIATLFCYDDLPFMLWFGTLAYGLSFVYMLPVWVAIDEKSEKNLPMWAVVVYTFAAMYAYGLTLDLLRYEVAPRVTQVQTDAVGLGYVEGSCLVPIKP